MRRTITTCDRCGAKAKDRFHWARIKVTYNVYEFDDGTTECRDLLDLCLTCRQAFFRFLNGKAKGAKRC